MVAGRAPFPFGFTVIADHTRVGELLMYCGLQSGVVPVSILINFRPRTCRTEWGGKVKTEQSLLLDSPQGPQSNSG